MGIIDGTMQPQAPVQQPQAPMQGQPQPPMLQQPAQGQPAQGQPAQGDPLSYAKVVRAATIMIYESNVMKKLLALIKNAQTPEIGLAHATTLIMAELVKKSNNKIPQEVKTPAAKEIMMLIAELAEKAGILKNAAEAVKQASMLIAQAIMKTAKIDPARLKQAKPANQFQPFMRKEPPVTEAAPVVGEN